MTSPILRRSLAMTLFLSGACLAQQGPNLVLQEPTTLDAGSAQYQATNSITNTATFTVQGAAAVTFTAGNYIQLGPGFHATAGSAATTFHALIASVSSTNIIDQPPGASTPTKEYIYWNGKVVAVENHH